MSTEKESTLGATPPPSPGTPALGSDAAVADSEGRNAHAPDGGSVPSANHVLRLRFVAVPVAAMLRLLRKNRKKAYIAVALVASWIAADLLLPMQSMELVVEELDMEMGGRASRGVTLESDFMGCVAEVRVTDAPGSIPKPTSFAFDTHAAGACRRFQIIYSARDRSNAASPAALMLIPRAAEGPSCSVGLDIASATGLRHFDLSADQKVTLVLGAEAPDGFLQYQPARLVAGRALKAKGGALDAAPTGTGARLGIAVAGNSLEIQELNLSKDDPDGALRLVLTTRSSATVKIENQNVSMYWRLEAIGKIRALLSKVLGH